MKIVKNVQLKIFIFTVVKNCSILHGHVFVMSHVFRTALATCDYISTWCNVRKMISVDNFFVFLRLLFFALLGLFVT